MLFTTVDVEGVLYLVGTTVAARCGKCNLNRVLVFAGFETAE